MNGTPLLSANTAINANGAPVTMQTTGTGGQVQITAPLQNTAATAATQSTSVALPDGSTTKYLFDKYGNPVSKSVSGSDGMTATTLTTNSSEGLPLGIQYPEGNFKTMTYDSGNPDFRSRGNLLTVTHNPGPRGGTSYTETYQYDPRYNLKMGAQVDGNGFTTTYQLSSDGTYIASIVHGSAGTETFAYDANGQMTSSTDVRGVSMTIQYDPTTAFQTALSLGTPGRAYTYTYGSDLASELGVPASISQALGLPVQTTYNANLQPLQIQRGALTQTFAYDELGHPVLRQTQMGDGSVLTVLSQYDVKGFLWTNVINGLEVNGQTSSLEYDYTPDPLSRIQMIHYPQGTVQTFGYDSRGNLTNIIVGDFTNGYVRDLNNNVVSVISGGDVVGANTFDGFDRVATTVQHVGTEDLTTSFSDYPEGELNSETVMDPVFGEVAKNTIDQIDELGRTVHSTIVGTTIAPTFQHTYSPLFETIVGPRMTTKTTWDSSGFDTMFTDPILTSTIQDNNNGYPVQVTRQEDGATCDDYFQYDNLEQSNLDGGRSWNALYLFAACRRQPSGGYQRDWPQHNLCRIIVGGDVGRTPPGRNGIPIPA